MKINSTRLILSVYFVLLALSILAFSPAYIRFFSFEYGQNYGIYFKTVTYLSILLCSMLAFKYSTWIVAVLLLSYSVSQAPSIALVPYSTNIVFFVLLGMLVINPMKKHESWKNYIYFLLSFFYISAFISKIRFSLTSWINGEALSYFLKESFLYTGYEKALYISNSQLICAALSLPVLIFELTFVIGYFKKWLRIYFIGAALLLHAGIYLLMNINFFYFFAITFVFFADDLWPIWQSRSSKYKLEKS